MGAMVLVVVIASIALIFRGRAFSFPAGGPEMKRFWNERSFQRGGWLREEKEEQVSGDFTTVEIRNIAGGIDIQGPTPGNDTGSNVGIHAVKTAMFPAAMENLNVAIEKRGDRLLIEERHAGGFVMSAGTVSFVITLPRGIKTIEAHSVSGSVTVRGVGAGIDQNLSTISGSIETTRRKKPGRILHQRIGSVRVRRQQAGRAHGVGVHRRADRVPGPGRLRQRAHRVRRSRAGRALGSRRRCLTAFSQRRDLL